MANKDFERDKQQAPKAGQGQQNMGDDGKNDREAGEPVQLDEKKPDQQGGQHPGTQNR